MHAIGSNNTIAEAVHTNSVPNAANLNRPANRIGLNISTFLI